MKKFDWYDFLNRAIAGKVKDSEITNAEDDAEDWVTCACGNQCSIIPRDPDGGPLDEKLYELGCQFSYAITDHAWKEAIKILDKIENRSVILIEKEVNRMIDIIKERGYKVTKK